MGEIGDASAVPVLVELMQDQNDAVGRAAAAALTNLPGREVDAAIVKILESPDRRSGSRCSEIAGQRRVAAALPGSSERCRIRMSPCRMAATRSYVELAARPGSRCSSTCS